METLFAVALSILAFGLISGRIEKSFITAPMVFVLLGVLVGRWGQLGRGGGFYDRFLRRLRRSATTVGLAFDIQIIDDVPADDRDFSVDIVVTDRRVTHAGGSRTRR